MAPLRQLEPRATSMRLCATPHTLLSEAASVCTLRFDALEALSLPAVWEARLHALVSGVLADCLVSWFELRLSAGVTISSSPTAAATAACHWRQVVTPLPTTQRMVAHTGDACCVRCEVRAEELRFSLSDPPGH